jgi:hypothetical protein
MKNDSQGVIDFDGLQIVSGRRAAAVALLLGSSLIGCHQGSSSPRAADSASHQTSQEIKPDEPQSFEFEARRQEAEHKACRAHQISETGCGEYRVLSYDATWRNEHGNVGAFALEREGLAIRAYCSSESCWGWADSVGKTIIADKSIDNLITHYDLSCEDPLYVKLALGRYRKMTKKSAAIAQVCDQTLIVQTIEAKGPK